MCGIYGFNKSKDFRDTNGTLFDLLTEMAVETQVRGRHATGYACRYLDGYKSFKKPLPASEFIDTDYWWRLAESMPESLVGHARYATMGLPKENKNNHPFQSRRYYMVHNGTLKTSEYLPFKSLCETECDSEAILRILQTAGGIKKGVKRVFKAMPESNLACVVLDKKTGKTHFFRSPDRPLVVWESKGLILYASTEEILENAYSNVIGVASKKIKSFKKWSPNSGTLYTLGTNLKWEKPLKLKKYPRSRMTTVINDPYSKKKPVRQFGYTTGLGYPEIRTVSDYRGEYGNDLATRGQGMVVYGD